VKLSITNGRNQEAQNMMIVFPYIMIHQRIDT